MAISNISGVPVLLSGRMVVVLFPHAPGVGETNGERCFFAHIWNMEAKVSEPPALVPDPVAAKVLINAVEKRNLQSLQSIIL